MKFTDKYISNLKPTDRHYFKRESDGFAIRVYPNETKSWKFIYVIAGKRKEMLLGEYPDVSLADARERAADARKVLKNGTDPKEAGFEWHHNPERERREAARKVEEDRCNPTVKTLAGDFITRYAMVKKRESSWKEDQRLLDKNVLPFWGVRKVKDIRKRDIKLLLEMYQDRPALCHNVLKVVRKMFNFAVDDEIIDLSPFVNVKPPVDLQVRTRILTEAEIKALWTTELPKAAMSDELKRIIKLILVTGQRPGEVAGIHASEVSGHWWTIPTARSKIKTDVRVYLTKTALELLGKSKGYFFPTPFSKKQGHIDDNAVAYAIRRNLKNYVARRPIKGEKVKMVTVPEEKQMVMAHFTPHDLRRTCGTFLAQLGFTDEVIDAALGHKKKGIIKVYNLYQYDKEKQKAMEAWERKIKAITTGVADNVIPMRRKRKASEAK